MALDKTFSIGEVLSAGDVNGHLLGLWIPIDKRVISSGSPVAAASFTGIDSAFRLFRLTYNAISNDNGLRLRFNNDSGTNYWRHISQTTAGGTTGFSFTSETYVDLNSSINAYNTGNVLIGKFASGGAATVVAQTVHWHPGGSSLTHTDIGSRWNNTSALINRIDFLVTSGTFYGVVALEGMRGS